MVNDVGLPSLMLMMVEMGLLSLMVNDGGYRPSNLMLILQNLVSTLGEIGLQSLLFLVEDIGFRACCSWWRI